MEPWSPRNLPMFVGVGGILLAWSAVMAESLRRFECWAWFFAMPWLCGTVLVILFRLWDLPTRRPRAWRGFPFR